MMKKTSPESETPFHPPAKPLLIVLSGPSGVGKDAVLQKLRQSGFPLTFITTATTRSRRPNERDGVDYHFISTTEFQKMVERKELLEYANVYGNWYGVPKKPVKEALKKGHDVIVKVDIQGAANIKKIVPQAVFIFLLSAYAKELEARLKQRQTETALDLELRLKTAGEEIKQLSLFDYLVLNKEGEIDAAVSQVQAIITAEKCRVTPREITLD
jgi:guanylate kinase